MSHKFNRASAGAGLGGVFGTAIDTLLNGVVIALPGVNIVLAPIVAAAKVSTVTVSGGAVGTLVGGIAGAISGAKADAKERRER